MSEQVNFVIEQYDSEELAEANELIGDMLINANIENKRLKAENAKLRDKYDSYEQKMDALVWTLTGGLLSKSASTPNDVLCSTVEESLTERIQSENAKLLAERDEWHRVAVSKQDIIDHMRDARAENAKLRELCISAYKCARHSTHATCEECMGMFGGCTLRTAMRELGVEVDG